MAIDYIFQVKKQHYIEHKRLRRKFANYSWNSLSKTSGCKNLNPHP